VQGEENGQPCLFGWDQMPWKGKRGKPPHLATPEKVNKVKMLLAFGWANSRIANALGISEPTLRKHYFSVLRCRAIARDALVARQAEKLWAQVEKGNVGAMKAFQKMVEDNDRALRSASLRTPEDDEDDDDLPVPTRPVARQGKKEQAVDIAQAALSIDPDLQPGRGGRPN